VTPKFRAWVLVAIVLALCGVSLWGVFQYRSRSLTPAALLKRLPTADALIVYIDFARLRAGGILELLDRSKVGEDAEYQAFVRKTDFDYKQDLDSALVAFAPSGKFMLLKGRFDWTSLINYVRNSDGDCNNSFCRLSGSTPERRISFFPLQTNLMALAVSSDESAAHRMAEVDSRPDQEVPDAPIWLSIPPSVMNSDQPLPAGTQMFARSLKRAQAVMLSIVPEADHFAAKLDVRCASAGDASELAAELTKTTGLLRELIEREHQTPNPADLSGFLTSGSFKSTGPRVQGYWPIQRALIENLLGGGG
jgi:hypothetical protein